MKNKSLPMSLLLICSLFLFTTLIYSQSQPKAWYVDKRATGLNNGTSWTNAWTSFSFINWTNIQPGDTVYISGGEDSLVYSGILTINKSGTANNPIVITKGKTTGHTGRVIIDSGTGTLYSSINVGNKCYLKISKLETKGALNGVRISGGAKAIYLDSLRITDYYDQAGISLNGWTADNSYGIDSIFISNTYIESYDYNAQVDNIYCLGVDHLVIENCILINNNLTYSSSNDYSDNIQTQNVGNAIIRNNILINNAGYGDQGIIGNFSNNAITSEVSQVEIYNNVIVFPNPAPIGYTGRCIMTRYYDWYISSGLPDIKIYSNTIYGNDRVTGVALQLPAEIKNNIIYTTDSYCIVQDNMADSDTVNNVIGNLMFKQNGGTFIGGKWRSLDGSTVVSQPSYTTWTNTLGGSTIITSNPVFSNIGNLDFSLQSSSPAINAGVDLSQFFTTDKDGKPRPLGTFWDIGAYEYSENLNGVDNTPPRVIGAALLDSVNLNIIFSEPLEPTGANNPANYSIDNGSTVLSANLINNNIVRLQTSVHAPGFYNITVSNITDTAGNLIDPQFNSANYGYNPDPLPELLKLYPARINASSVPEPEHLPEKTYDGLGYNSGDPHTRWAAQYLPQWIGYDLGDIVMLSKTRIQFYNWENGRIYHYSIQVSTDSLNWTNIKTNIQSQLAEWSVENFDPVPARYIRILVLSNNQSDWANIWETEFYGQLMISNNDDGNNIPSEFKLEQNYPNPFNPTTKIRFSLPASSLNPFSKGEGTLISLKVFDLLGNEVATLVNEFKQPGTYEVEFDASNLSSGVYIYRLQADKFVNTRKMILLR